MKEFVTLNLREQDYTFRALDLDQIEQLEPQFVVVASLAVAGDAVPKEAFAAVAAIACESLRYKRPDITVAECRKIITIGTLQNVIEAVRGVSGLDAAAGEGPARAV